MNETLSPAAKKIIKAGLTETNPKSIAVATGLTVQAVFANLNSLKKHNLAVYDSESKVLTLTAEGMQLANEVDIAEPAEPIVTTLKVEVTGTGTKKQTAWAIIQAFAKNDADNGTETPRKDIVAALVDSLKVTSNNASQYIQNYRKAHGLVVPREAKVEAIEGDKVVEPVAALLETEDKPVEEGKEPTVADETSDAEDPTDI